MFMQMYAYKWKWWKMFCINNQNRSHQKCLITVVSKIKNSSWMCKQDHKTRWRVSSEFCVHFANVCISQKSCLIHSFLSMSLMHSRSFPMFWRDNYEWFIKTQITDFSQNFNEVISSYVYSFLGKRNSFNNTYYFLYFIRAKLINDWVFRVEK